MATSIKKRLESARAKRDKAMNAVFAACADDRTPFQTCLANAPAAVRDAYIAASQTVWNLENDALRECKAYRGTFGTLTFYR